MVRRLAVLGSVNADHILRVDSFPRPGETVTGSGYRVVPGGKGANQAVAAARLGGEVRFIACVGDDDFGRRMIGSFAEEGIDTRGVMQIPDTPTGVAIIYVSSNGENSIGISPEANACLTPERLSPHLSLIRDSDALLMQLETPLDAIEVAATAARDAGVRVVLNPAPARSLPDSLLRAVHMITPNETEAEVLTGIAVSDDRSAQQAADALHAGGVEQVLITLGARGVWVSTGSGGHLVPGFRVSARDTTAAGDTFNGALMVRLLEDLPMDEALRFAHAAAALSVTRIGAQTSIPRRGEVEEFLAQAGS